MTTVIAKLSNFTMHVKWFSDTV